MRIYGKHVLNENLTANKIIKKIICEYEKNKYIDKMPHFILKFFERIEYEIEKEVLKKQKVRYLKSMIKIHFNLIGNKGYIKSNK